MMPEDFKILIVAVSAPKSDERLLWKNTDNCSTVKQGFPLKFMQYVSINSIGSIWSIHLNLWINLSFYGYNHRYGWCRSLISLDISTIVDYRFRWKLKRRQPGMLLCILHEYTVKLARAKLPAKAAGKLIRRWKYLRMQAKISAGTDCLRFLRVTGGYLPAPAGNSQEVFIVRVRANFFKPRDVYFYPVPNTLTKGTICWLWSQAWTLQIWICSKKSWTVPCWLLKPLSKKTSLKKSSLPSKWSGNGCCHLNLKKKERKKALIGLHKNVT